MSSWLDDDEPGEGARRGLEAARADQADRLKRAAAELAAEGGPRAVTAGGIAARAGVSRATLLELFGSREACAYAAADETVEAILARLARCGSCDAGERIHETVRALFEFCAEQPAASGLALVEIVGIGEDGARRRRDALDRIAGVLAARLRDADPYLPDLTPTLVAGGLVDVAATRLSTGRAEELPGLLPDLVDTLLGGAEG